MPSPVNLPYSGVPGGNLYEREESAHDNPTPSMHIQTPPDAFGGNIAEATQHLGQVSEQAGQELFDRAYAMQELHAHANVETSLADATNAMQDRLVQHKMLEGNAAQVALPSLQDDIDKIRTGATKGMSPYEIQLYDAGSRRAAGQAKFSAATWSAQQGKVYQTGAADATINASIRGMALDPNNTADSIAKINQAVDQKSDLMGLPANDPQRDMMRKTTVDTAVQTQLHAMAREDPIKALATYNSAIKSGALFTNEAMNLKGTLENLASERGARDAAQGSMSGAVPPIAQGPPPPASFFESRVAPGHGAIDVKDLQPGFSAPLSRAVEDAEKATGDKVQFTSGFRTYGEQAALAADAPGSGRVGPAAAPGTSMHERGLAADIAPGPARDYIMQHAAEYGLGTVKNDPEHVELARATGTSPQVHTIGAADRVAGGGVLGVLINAESRGQNIVSGTDSDSHGLKASQGGNASEISQGYFQIQNHPGGTWSIYAQKAGVDLSKYPSPRSAPYDVQWQVAQTIPVNQWGPRTQQMLAASGYKPLPGETLGQMNARYGGSTVQGQGVTPVNLDSTTVYHSTVTPEQSADRPLADVLQDAMARLDPSVAAIPGVREKVEAQVETQYARNEKITADTNKHDMQTIAGGLYGPSNPSSLGDLRAISPEVGAAVERLMHNNPEAIPKIQEAMNKNAKGDVPQTPERLKKYAELKTMASVQPEEFAKQDLLSAGLPMAWTKELVDAQVKGEGKTPYDPNLAAALRQPGIADQIQTLGIDPKTPDYNTLAAELGDEMKQFQTDNKRPPNAKEREEIATRLLQDKAIDGGLWDKFKGAFGYGPSTEKFFRMQAPADWANQMKARVETEQGYTPTPMEINRVWNQMQYQKEYGSAGGKAESKIQLPQQPKGTGAALDKAASIPTALPKAGVDTDLPGPNHIPNWGPWHAGGTPTGPIIPGYVPKGNK